jgi:SAM-dependent methyltransferase
MAIEEIYLHPEDYDLEVSNRDVHDLPFWLGLIAETRPKSVLEVGCGTGRLTIPLAREGVKAGFRVMGIDPEPAMLKQAERALQEEPAAIRRALCLRKGDIRDIRMRRKFDLVIMSYGAAHHLLSLEEQLAAFQNARRLVHTDGLFCVDVDAPRMSVLRRLEQGTPPRRDIDAQGPDGRRLRRVVNSHYAPSQQRAIHEYNYFATDADRTRRHYESTFAMHVYFPRELELLCIASGFMCERMIGDYEGRPFDDQAHQMILVARAA